MNNVLASMLAILLFLGTAFVVVSTSTVDAGFKVSDEEQAVMDAYDRACPFTAAERQDLVADDSVRKYVEIVDVYCDEEKSSERVVVRPLEGDDAFAKEILQQWMIKNQIPTQHVEIHMQNGDI